jgi:hypothetical protein
MKMATELTGIDKLNAEISAKNADRITEARIANAKVLASSMGSKAATGGKAQVGIKQDIAGWNESYNAANDLLKVYKTGLTGGKWSDMDEKMKQRFLPEFVNQARAALGSTNAAKYQAFQQQVNSMMRNELHKVMGALTASDKEEAYRILSSPGLFNTEQVTIVEGLMKKAARQHNELVEMERAEGSSLGSRPLIGAQQGGVAGETAVEE